ncbi:hypothetical protein LM599_01080 [Candidatus Acetothermia bacterium]|jgi:hypothetical protein|nr:hypothetical protein [Candidatus Acetothermia bacterium]
MAREVFRNRRCDVESKVDNFIKNFDGKKGGDQMERKTAKKKFGEKQQLVCGQCGLVVMVDEVCSCVDYCDLVCCGEEMKSMK